MHLLTDITSTFNPHHCYGRKGDKVTVISKHHNVAIVEGENKNNLAVHLDQLSRDEVKADVAAIAIPERKTKATKQKISNNKNQLFS